MEYLNISFIVYFVLISSILITKTHCAKTNRRLPLLSKAEEDDIERQLKVLNKKPIKTITTKIGDIIDCIDIYKQPAFDHPLLKNHKIQMDPSSIPGETTAKTISSSSVFRGLQRQKCPPGTVPIRRTTKQDLIIDKYLLRNASSMGKNDYPVTQMNYHFVSIEENIPGKVYFGGTASITAHDLTVGLDQFSTSQVWIQSGGPEGVNSIQFGFAKYPLIFGDSRSRLFGYWTADGDLLTGCFNIRCPGFVQVSRNTTFGDDFDQSSVYGEIVYDESFMVYRNPVTGHWWLSMGATADKSEPIGYWPKELFTHLATSASVVRFGGVAGAVSGRPTPPLGNGYLPRLDDYLKTAFMSKMKYVDDKGEAIDLDMFSMQTKKDARPDCYDIWLAGKLGGGWGITMVYGGPGGMC